MPVLLSYSEVFLASLQSSIRKVSCVLPWSYIVCMIMVIRMPYYTLQKQSMPLLM